MNIVSRHFKHSADSADSVSHWPLQPARLWTADGVRSAIHDKLQMLRIANEMQAFQRFVEVS
jgi:hypothetical protein